MPAKLVTLVRVDLPSVARVFGCPFGGEREVVCDRLTEVVGDVFDEPPVKQVALTGRIGGGPLYPAVRIGDLLVAGCRVSFACVEVNRVAGFCFGVPGQRLVYGVLETFGEGLVILPADECDGGWSGLVGWGICLPGMILSGEFQRLAVHTG